MQAGNGFGEVYFLVTRPDFSGPVPNRIPPNKAVPVQSTPLSAVSKRSLSLHSTPEATLDIDDEIDDFDDMDDSAVKHRKSSLNNNISNFVLSLPPFETGSPLKVVLSPSLFKSIYDVWTSFVLPAYLLHLVPSLLRCKFQISVMGDSFLHSCTISYTFSCGWSRLGFLVQRFMGNASQGSEHKGLWEHMI